MTLYCDLQSKATVLIVIRVTQRFVSGNICSGDFFGETSSETFVTRRLISSFFFFFFFLRDIYMSFRVLNEF